MSSFNEWDPLEEVIVGQVSGAMVPPWHISLQATLPEGQWDFFQQNAGKPFPAERMAAAHKDLEAFVRVLEREGVTVRRPEATDFGRSFSTPHWDSKTGLYAAMPRDLLLVVGDELIESPMAWRCRQHEVQAYRPLLKEYFRSGARWTAAPRPELTDALYDASYAEPDEDDPPRYVITEEEPTFDAADFSRCGRDIFVQQSNVTNAFGIEWLRRHLGNEYRIHVLRFRDTAPMHIDATFVPLAPGRLLLNPERATPLPDMFRSWEVLYAPAPSIPDSHPLYMTSKWINMNVLSLDERRVVVEQSDAPMIAALRSWGFEPIPCPFRDFNSFGGSFHCATLDVRRRGSLQSYF